MAVTQTGSRSRWNDVCGVAAVALLAVALAGCGEDEATGRERDRPEPARERQQSQLASVDPSASVDTDARAGTAGDEDPLFLDGLGVYARCQACHSLDPNVSRSGPHLAGIFGRPAGAVETFNYSNAMLESGIIWDEETLAAYMRDVRGFIPGNRMTAPDLRNEQDIAALLHYLRSAAAEP